ncbi:MAG: penicillin acylase family protein [Arenimonas sp.]
MTRLLPRLALVILLLLAVGACAAWYAVHNSLAQLDGELSLPGLSAPVAIERDALGVVTIRAANQTDAARALGYVHGQERFFEMDLLRRSAAGELSELFGEIALEKDRSIRVHRLRARVVQHLDAVAGGQMPVLIAYTEGVNTGLARLHARPWPYLLLGAQPRPWQPADTALAGYAMFFDLQDEANSRELALWKIRQVVPDQLFKLLAADGTEWDAPLRGTARGDVALPGPDTLDMRKLAMPADDSTDANAEPAAPGSNNFAVSGALTADGRAIVANDMHLGLRAPNIWFRARLQYNDQAAPGGKVDISGFTLPGIPAVVVGSNTHVAWGFTNSYGDWLDFYTVQWTDAAHTRYRGALGELSLHVAHEKIRIKGRPTQDFPVRETIWGPVTEDLDAAHSLALRWAAHQTGAINLGLTRMAAAADLDSALASAGNIGMPAQNMVIGDAKGRIAWRLTAQMPKRVGVCDMQTPIDPITGCDWSGWRAGDENPALIDPPSGRLWTANARTVDGDALQLLGDAGYANGARARQIRNALFAQNRFTERDLLSIQLDNRAIFLDRWWRLLRAQAKGSREKTWVEFEAATRDWNGHAATASVSYRLVRDWRLAVLERSKRGLLAPAMARLGKRFVMPDLPQFEGVAWQLASQQPVHLLPRKYSSWDALFLDAARSVARDLQKKGPLARRNWGERNTAAICHPLAKALPRVLRPSLCMPADALAGDVSMPRVAGPSFGASERMVVSPGHEVDGIIHMPGGQSGNPLSPFWGAGHQAWVTGEPTPFLPGPVEHRMTLRPR